MLNKFIKCKILSVLGVGDGGGTGYNCSLNTCSVCSLVNVVLLVPRAGDNQSVRRRTLNHCFSRIQSELLPMRTINKFCVLGTPEWKLRTSHHDPTVLVWHQPRAKIRVIISRQSFWFWCHLQRQAPYDPLYFTHVFWELPSFFKVDFWSPDHFHIFSRRRWRRRSESGLETGRGRGRRKGIMLSEC